MIGESCFIANHFCLSVFELIACRISEESDVIGSFTLLKQCMEK